MRRGFFPDAAPCHTAFMPRTPAPPTFPVTDASRIELDARLIERWILELARFGASGATGVRRLVYTPEWCAAADQYARWCAESGLDLRRDAVGNVWGVLRGREAGASIVSGSHLDSQVSGGRYDGALGALSALLALRVLKERYGQPKRTLEAVALCEEESSRFPNTNFWGSRAVSDGLAPDEPEQITAFGGETMAQAMRDAGLDPTQVASARRTDIDTFIELHIEQGPILEQAGLPAAIVTAITGIREYYVRLVGVQNHAGAFPMDLRRDPMAGFAEIASGVIATAHRMGRPAVTTVGRVVAQPNYPAIIPASVEFTVDARHPDPQARELLYARHEALMREVAGRRGLEISWRIATDHAPALSDPALVALLEQAAGEQQVPVMKMASGAAHDTQQMARIAKVAMVFVRSKDGRSHTPEEFSSIADIVQGVRVLAAGLRALAY